MLPQSGELIHGKYRVLRPLADGGMGTIYEARHEVLGTSVALKVLHPNLARRPNLVARFLQEAKLSATLVSPHIVRVLDVEQGPQGVLLVMELLRGETLQAMLDRQHRLEVPQAIDFALQMLDGLKVAHAASVVHRDLKPDNVFITAGPLLKLLDFGIAKLRTSPEFDRGLTRPGVVMGTPEYMAPEQAFSADTVDARADLYALGVILFEMLSGQRPVRGDDPKQIAQRVFSGHVTALSALLPSLPMTLVSAVHRAMAPNPRGRFDSAEDMRQALLPFAPSAHPGTAVLGPIGHLSTPPAPTQPTPGTLPQPPANHHTPAFSAAPTPSLPPAATGPSATPSLTGPMAAWASAPTAPAGPAATPPPGTPVLGRDPGTPAPHGSLAPHNSPTPALATGAPGQPSQTGLSGPYGPTPPTAAHALPSTTAAHAVPAATAAHVLPAATAAHAPLWSPAGTAPASPLQPGAPPYGEPAYGHPYGGNGYGGSTSYGAPLGPGATEGRGGTALGGPSYTSLGAEMPTATPPLPVLPPGPSTSPPRRGAPVGLIAALAALAGGLAVVLVIVLRDRGDSDSPVPPAPTPPPPVTASVTAPVVTTPGLPPTIPPLPPITNTPPPTSPGPGPGPAPTPRDAGADGAPGDAGPDADGGRDGGLLGKLPLPPIPSSLPPLPSSLPPIKIPIPLPF